MNEYFINVTESLDIPELKIEHLPRETGIVPIDPIDRIIHEYQHPIVLMINEQVKPVGTFSFIKINEKHIKNGILVLNPKKSAGFDAIPSQSSKDAVTILTTPLTHLFNPLLESLCPSDLKYDVTPQIKRIIDQSVFILSAISKIFEMQMFKQITSYISSFPSPYIYVVFVKAITHSMRFSDRKQTEFVSLFFLRRWNRLVNLS